MVYEDVTPFTESTVDDLSCSVADVYKVLSSLDVNKANGPDAISPRILKECAAELAPSISQLFNFSLVHGKLPSVWKSANVRGGEWFFKNSGSHKILVEFHGSRSLVF